MSLAQLRGARGAARAEAVTLAFVLRDEIARGARGLPLTTRRYSLNGGLPEDVKRALSRISRPDDRG
jgi:hypothetical protein